MKKIVYFSYTRFAGMDFHSSKQFSATHVVLWGGTPLTRFAHRVNKRLADSGIRVPYSLKYLFRKGMEGT